MSVLTGRNFTFATVAVAVSCIGCSSEPPPSSVQVSTDELSLEVAQRLHEVADTSDVPPARTDERRRTGIVSSLAEGILHLNENGQVVSYSLGKDVKVYYPGGMTDVSDLRQGDKVTIFIDEADRPDSDAPLVITRMDKHTASQKTQDG